MPAQLTLPVRLQDTFTFSNFYAGKNQPQIDYLKSLCEPFFAENYIYLCGPSGSGRSHLLQAICLAAQEKNLQSIYLPLLQIKQLNPLILENLETISIVCLDDIAGITHSSIWEEAVFHLYNRCQMKKCLLVISDKLSPHELNMQLPDLASRLNSGVNIQLKPFDDAEKIAALQLKAKSRGFELSNETAQFVLQHLPRDLNNLFTFLEQLDDSSFTQQRKLTIPFVKKVLQV